MRLLIRCTMIAFMVVALTAFASAVVLREWPLAIGTLLVACIGAGVYPAFWNHTRRDTWDTW